MSMVTSYAQTEMNIVQKFFDATQPHRTNEYQFILNSKDAATIVLNAMSECALFGTHGNASGLRVGIVGAAVRIIS